MRRNEAQETKPVWRQLRKALAILILVALSISGFWGVDQEWKYAADFATRFSTFLQSAYAVLGFLAVPVLLLHMRGTRLVLYVWAGCLILTGATAPVVWAHSGGWVGFFVACMMAVVSGAVIWLVPLPEVQGPFRRWRWLMAGLFAVAAVVVLSTLVRLAPAALRGRDMEAFCEGVNKDLDEKDLAAAVQRQGYIATPGSDGRGALLKITSDEPSGNFSYSCQARFKPDGKLASISFTGNAKEQ